MEKVSTKNKPPYLIGLLGLIPLFGAFVGFRLVVSGIWKYRDRKLIAIGAADILFTIIVYTALYYDSIGPASQKANTQLSQQLLTTIANTVEVYKMRNGKYPDSLQQLRNIDPRLLIDDPILIRKSPNGNTRYTYMRIGEHYKLFSKGFDTLPGTTDDLYPAIQGTGRAAYGLIFPDSTKKKDN